MKNLKKLVLLATVPLAMHSCRTEEPVSGNGGESPASNNVTLHFNNTFKATTLVLGDANSATATVNTSANGQTHRFSEVKYVVSNIRLIKADGSEFPYNINDLDKGATVVDQSKASTLEYVMDNIPAGEYKQIKFGLGIKKELNKLDQLKFPKFYANVESNDTQMMWDWGTGYRFVKLEGFYEKENKIMSIHTGSTVTGKKDDPTSYKQGVDAYRDVTLNLTTNAVVGKKAPKITINADFDKLLSGKSNTIKLTSGDGMEDNATPNIHTVNEMVKFVDNLGGNGTSDISGMFSIGKVEN